MSRRISPSTKLPGRAPREERKGTKIRNHPIATPIHRISEAECRDQPGDRRIVMRIVAKEPGHAPSHTVQAAENFEYPPPRYESRRNTTNGRVAAVPILAKEWTDPYANFQLLWGPPVRDRASGHGKAFHEEDKIHRAQRQQDYSVALPSSFDRSYAMSRDSLSPLTTARPIEGLPVSRSAAILGVQGAVGRPLPAGCLRSRAQVCGSAGWQFAGSDKPAPRTCRGPFAGQFSLFSRPPLRYGSIPLLHREAAAASEDHRREDRRTVFT